MGILIFQFCYFDIYKLIKKSINFFFIVLGCRINQANTNACLSKYLSYDAFRWSRDRENTTIFLFVI